jgi:hypothetical protein
MNDEYYYWKCQNRECECAGNRIKKSTVDYANNVNKKVRPFCSVCGFAPMSIRLNLEHYDGTAAQACDCIKFTGDSSRLPTWRDNNGMYVDANGVEYGLNYFLNLGIQPDFYLRWVEHNKKPNHIDLRKVR